MPKPLAEIAIDAGLISRAELSRVAQVADEQGLPMVVAMVRSAGVDEVSLVAAVRRQARVPITDPGSVQIDSDAMREIDRDVCRRLRVFPLDVSVYDSGAKVLRLAMADPTDAVAVAEVQHHTGCRLETTLMPLSAVEETIEEAYRTLVTEVIHRAPGPFGADLKVSTQPMARPPGASDAGGGPTTTPYHRLSDDAELSLRHRALLDLLVRKELITEDEYEAEVRALMKRREGNS